MRYYTFDTVRSIKRVVLKNLAKDKSIKGMDYYDTLKHKKIE